MLDQEQSRKDFPEEETFRLGFEGRVRVCQVRRRMGIRPSLPE